MRYIALITLLLWGGSAFAEENKYQLTITPEVMEKLNAGIKEERGRNDQKERAGCLLGHLKGRDVLVANLYIHRQINYLHKNDNLEWCPSGTIAYWHTHPRSSCVLSEGDIRFALNKLAPPFMVVQTDPNYFCWWHRDQIREFVARNGGKPCRPAAVRLDKPGVIGSWARDKPKEDCFFASLTGQIHQGPGHDK
ncbi:MAG TPA: hypothetical protein VJG29_00210 [Candidatus Paceibacterota bacterium]